MSFYLEGLEFMAAIMLVGAGIPLAVMGVCVRYEKRRRRQGRQPGNTGGRL